MSLTRNITRFPTAPRLHPHCVFYVDPWRNGNLRDYVSGTHANFVRSSSLTGMDKSGTYVTVPADHPLIGPWGLMSDGAGTNLILYSNDMTAGVWGGSAVALDFETVEFSSDGGYFRYRIGSSRWSVDETYTFSATVEPADENESEQIVLYFTDFSNPKSKTVFNPKNGRQRVDVTHTVASDASTLYCGIDSRVGQGGDGKYAKLKISWALVENKPYASSPIYTNGSTASRATQAADSSGNGVAWDLSKLHPDVLKSLDGTIGEGTLIVKWRPGVTNSTSLTDSGIFNTEINKYHPLYMRDDGRIGVYDQTNTAEINLNFQKNTTYTLVAKWGKSNNNLSIRELSSDLRNSNSFNGDFKIGTDIALAATNEHPQHFGPIKLYSAPLSDAEIEREASKM